MIKFTWHKKQHAIFDIFSSLILRSIRTKSINVMHTYYVLAHIESYSMSPDKKDVVMKFDPSGQVDFFTNSYFQSKSPFPISSFILCPLTLQSHVCSHFSRLFFSSLENHNPYRKIFCIKISVRWKMWNKSVELLEKHKKVASRRDKKGERPPKSIIVGKFRSDMTTHWCMHFFFEWCRFTLMWHIHCFFFLRCVCLYYYSTWIRCCIE